MRCPFCNQEIEDGSRFCAECGKQLPTENMQASGGNQEETTGTAVEMVSETMNKKSKKWVIPVAAAAAAAAVGAGAFVAVNLSDPKETVIDAFKSITAEGQVNPAEDIFGMGEYLKNMKSSSGEFSLGLTMEDSSISELAMIKGGSADLTLYKDAEPAALGMDLGVGYAGMDIATLQFYIDEEQVMMAVPELSSRSFVLNYGDDLAGQLEASPYVGPMLAWEGVDPEALDSLISQGKSALKEHSEMLDLGALWTRYKEGSGAVDELKEAMTVEKIDKKEFTIDGKDVKCKGYHVTVPGDALIDFAETTKDFFLDDEILKDDVAAWLDTVIELQESMGASYDTDGQSGKDMQKQLWKDAESEIDSLIDALDEVVDDVEMDVYVRKDGSMAGFSFETKLKADDEDFKIEGDATFGGGYNMLANVEAVVDIEDDAGDTISFKINKEGEYEKGKLLTGELTASITGDYVDMSLAFENTFNIKDGSYDGYLKLNDDGENIVKISADGYFDDIVKGEAFEMYFDSLKISVYDGEEYIDVSGYYKMKPLDGEIDTPAGKAFDILSGTAAEYEEIAGEIQQKVMGLLQQLPL